MKNVFILSSLILTVGYPVAMAAETIGIISFPLPDFSAVVSAYAAVGVLAFAFRDYSRPSSSRPRSTVAIPQTGSRPARHGLSLTHTTLHAS